jgi:DtxR family Mn-dependent transcriptional regulator
VTHSEENYLKAIFHLGLQGRSAISTNAIAEQMDTKPSSVTDMVKKLSEKGLVNYKRYQGVSLTEKGRLSALAIIRKHRLWEVFLVEKLQFSWDEVHEVAEQLEHIKSEKLIDRIDQLLNFPKFDPHGDPIPGKNGEFHERDKKVLSGLGPNAKGIFVGVKDSSASFLKFLDRNQISLGQEITVLEVEEFDGSLRISHSGREVQISNMVAANLYIKIPENPK